MPARPCAGASARVHYRRRRLRSWRHHPFRCGMRRPIVAALLVVFIANAGTANAQSTRAVQPISLADAVRRVESDGFDVRMAVAQAALSAADAGTARAAY